MNGKGSKPRSCFSQQFRDNYDRIFKRPLRVIQTHALPCRPIRKPTARGAKVTASGKADTRSSKGNA
jgi:hypothetical protein